MTSYIYEHLADVTQIQIQTISGNSESSLVFPFSVRGPHPQREKVF